MVQYLSTYERQIISGKQSALRKGLRLWSSEEDQQLKEHYISGIPIKQIALEHQRTERAIRGRIAKKNLSQFANRRPRFTKEQDFYLKRYYGILSVLEISNHLNIRPRVIHQRAIKLNLTGRYIGERHPNSTVSDEDVEFIRCLADEGLGCTEISRKMEVSLSHVKVIINYSSRTRLSFMPDSI